MSNAVPVPPWAALEMRDASNGEPASADIRIYGPIGASYWDASAVGASDFAAQIGELDVERINVFINSPGGDAWDGLAIMNSLRRHPASVHVTVDGVAASAASVIAMAADHLVMNLGSEMMIHDASGGAWGNAQTMREMATVLDKLSDSYASVYAARAGGDPASWRAAMTAETWYSAAEAVEAGLADEHVSAPKAQALAPLAPAARLPYSRYHCRAEAPAPTKLPASEPGGPIPTTKEEVAMSTNPLLEGLRSRLGLADADDKALLAALDERLSQPKPALPDGVVAIDKDVLATLQADAAAGREAAATLKANRLEGIVATALAEGRITPASAPAWREMLAKDEEGASALLASLVPNSVPVAEVGLGSAGDETASDEEKAYAAWVGEGKN